MQDAQILLATATALLAVLQIISDIRIYKLRKRVDLLDHFTIQRILMEKMKEEQKNGNKD